MRRIFGLIAFVAVFALPASAQTADEIVARYIKAVGGMEKIQAVQSLRRSGKYIGGGGFEAVILQENKRDASVREEFSLQGMTAINAYDGKTGWKIEPWNGPSLSIWSTMRKTLGLGYRNLASAGTDVASDSRACSSLVPWSSDDVSRSESSGVSRDVVASKSVKNRLTSSGIGWASRTIGRSQGTWATVE